MRETGIRDTNGVMIVEGDIVKFPKDKHNLKVIWVGDGDNMDWAADKLNGEPDAWLDSTCTIISKT